MESNEQNKTRGIDTWKRLTDLKGDKGWRDWKRLAEEHICIAPGHRKQCGEGGGGTGWR